MEYDIIGDVHGHADSLRALLARMEYVESGGAYRHPSRQAIFVGDFVDRGPKQVETVDIVRRMVDAGTALAVMGNHELNAVAWYLPDPARSGEYLRVHEAPPWGEKNRKQHAAFLKEVEEKPDLHKELVQWFPSLPLWIELPELRVVHACWHPEHLAWLEPWLEGGRCLTEGRMTEATREGSRAFVAIECLTKGVEIDLPNGVTFRDKDGHERRRTRIRWWDEDAATYRDAAHLSPELCDQLPHSPIPESARVRGVGEKPLFVGHYWLTGEQRPLSKTVACVDYSAGMGHPLVAYRFRGEAELSPAGFVTSRS